MKKGFSLAMAVLLALGIAFMGSTPVQANGIIHHPSLPDPTAVPSTEGSDLTSEILGQSALPGTVPLASGQIAPLGFVSGEAQFGGPGLQVSGMTKPTTAAICFPFPSYRYKWTGKIYKWDGAAWMAVPTSFPKDGDGVVNWACTSAAGNGTYSLIIWYIGPPEPAAESPAEHCRNIGGIWTGDSCFF